MKPCNYVYKRAIPPPPPPPPLMQSHLICPDDDFGRIRTARTSLDDNFSPFNCFVPFIIQGYDNDFFGYPFYLDIFSISQKRLLHFFLLKEFKITYFRQGYTYITQGSRHHNYDNVIYYTKLYKREV